MVTGLKQFLPAGPVASADPPSRDGMREQHLVQVWSDHGMRTLAVADIQLKNPRKRKKAAEE
jgi:hypothetical protein